MTRYHALAPTELHAIASGDPNAPVIEALLSAQYSKRIVMISAILAIAADRCPGEHARLEAAYGLLAAAQQADPSAVQTILTHPSVGRWAAHCLRGLQAPSDGPVLTTDLGQLAAVAAVAAIRAGHTFVIEMPMRNRSIMLPALGLATLGPEAPSAATDSPTFAIVNHDGRRGSVTITAGRNVVTLPADPSQDGPGWQGLRSLDAYCGDTSIAIELDDLDQRQDSDGVPLACRQSADAVAAWQAALDGAWEILTRHHPRRANALAAGLRSITPLTAAGKGAMSFTDPTGFGGLALTPPRDPLSLADTLVHEFQHSVLSAVTDLTPLHTAGPDAVYYSPWREDPRPIEGLLQGAYAYLGVTGYWATQRSAVTGPDQALAHFELARWRHQIRSTAQALLESGYLTAAGTALVRGMAATAERWRDLPVAVEPGELAERAAADHWVRWRLRNCHPAPAAVNAIAHAWRSGQPCPRRPDEIPMTVLPQQGLLSLSERARLLRLRLADPGQFRKLCADPSRRDTVSDADLAYAADDFERAARGYRAAIEDSPAEIESWSGLALATTELSGRMAGSVVAPELARSVYLAILESTGIAPDLNKLQKWMELGQAGTAIVAARKLSRASQRPAKPVRGRPPGAGTGTRKRALKVPLAPSMVISASAKPSQRPVSGNQALYTASLAQNSRRSQEVSGNAADRSRSRARSVGWETSSRTPPGRAVSGSACRPIAVRSPDRATAAAQYPVQWVMLPTMPGGHCGAPR
jgi:HEXXH motif-containing protein